MIESISVKIAVFAPMPSASVRTAVTANPGDLRNCRNANFASASSDSSLGHCHASRPRSSISVDCRKPAARPRRFLAAHAFAHELLSLFFDMLAHLLGEIAIKIAAVEKCV